MWQKWRIQRGISSAGRAPALQAGGRRFDPVILHQKLIEVRSKRQRLLLAFKLELFFNKMEEVK
jgi:hypothetical protein